MTSLAALPWTGAFAAEETTDNARANRECMETVPASV
jgi:hypothetical protein